MAVENFRVRRKFRALNLRGPTLTAKLSENKRDSPEKFQEVRYVLEYDMSTKVCTLFFHTTLV